MATKEELAAMYNLDIESTLDYESETTQPRKVVTVDKKENGALALTWADANGVIYRHTTTQYNPPSIKPGDVVVGGWLADGYFLPILPKKNGK